MKCVYVSVVKCVDAENVIRFAPFCFVGAFLVFVETWFLCSLPRNCHCCKVSSFLVIFLNDWFRFVVSIGFGIVAL